MGCALIPDDSDEIDNMYQSVRNGLQEQKNKKNKKKNKVSSANCGNELSVCRLSLPC